MIDRPNSLLIVVTTAFLGALTATSCHKMSEDARGAGDDDGAGDADNDVDVDTDADDDPPPDYHLPPDIATGGWHSCAVDFFGGAKCWGANLYGQLGNGEIGQGEMELAPVDVIDLGGAVQALVAGNDFTCALVGQGAAKCWGRSEYGELGYGSYIDSPVPVQVEGLESGVQVVAAGHEHACAVTAEGALKCWGSNEGGRLGNGEGGEDFPDAYYTPQDVVGLDSGVASVSCAYHHSCAILEDGSVMCWGRDLPAYVLDEDVPLDLVPTEMPELGDDNRAVVTGTMHTCVLKNSGAVECLGFNAKGQLGDGSYGDSPTPVEVIDLPVPARGITAGGYSNCALLQGGGVKCWGNGTCLGVGSDYDFPLSSPTPLPVHGLGMGVANVSSEFEHVCARLETGSVWCWGSAGTGQCGNGTTEEQDQWWPNKVPGI
jgi:alpha-tubulin suppressor-like RCC1 family protein